MTDSEKLQLIKLAAEMALGQDMPIECIGDWGLPKTTPKRARKEIARAANAARAMCREWSRRIMAIVDERQEPIDVTKPGTSILIYTDEGPKGPCGQSVSVMCPKTAVHVFRDEAAMRKWAKEHENALTAGKRSQVRFLIVGDEEIIGTSFEVHR